MVLIWPFFAVFFAISWLFFSLTLYFLPLITARIRKHNDFIPITFLNIFLGWTYLGWLSALIWAFGDDVKNSEYD